MGRNNSLKVVLLLTIAVCCLFELILDRQSGVLRAFEAALLSLRWILLVCLIIWCCTFVLLTGILNDLPLIGLLFIAIAAFFIAPWLATDAITLLFGVTLGRATRALLNEEVRMKNEEVENVSILATRYSPLVTFLVGLVMLLAFSSFWHLDMADNSYHGPRWMGLWNDPNEYGILMGAGVVLATGLLAASPKSRVPSPQSESGKTERIWQLAIRNSQFAVLLIAVFMMGVGLMMSYSRGAWAGTVIGLLYVAKAYGKFKWRWVLPPASVALAVVCLFWNNTADNAPWYLKRLDFGRASAQHRVAAWKAGFEMMRDHPFGVGWNKTVETYEENYSPPEGGAAAITTNDYLMLGTQIGIPALLCFAAYVALCFKGSKPTVHSPRSLGKMDVALDSTKVACRAGTLTMLVAFWFDGGLFKLATASVFWILLELGSVPKPKIENRQSEIDKSLVTSAATK